METTDNQDASPETSDGPPTASRRRPPPFAAQTKHSGTARQGRPGGRGRRRSSGNNLVVISWRDIPAQVNAGSGATRVQRILPRRFQKAIDQAAMVAGKTQASQYVAEWRRNATPAPGDDPEAAALTAAADLEDAFPMTRLMRFVHTGGWDPDRPDLAELTSADSQAQPETDPPQPNAAETDAAQSEPPQSDAPETRAAEAQAPTRS